MKKTLLTLLMVFSMLFWAGSGFAANDLIGGDGGVEHWVHITSVSVSPSNTSVAVGSQASFTATAYYSDGSSQDVTASAAGPAAILRSSAETVLVLPEFPRAMPKSPRCAGRPAPEP